jgi:inorganic pyrophosphatase
MHYKDLNKKRVSVFDWHEKDVAFNILKKGYELWKH